MTTPIGLFRFMVFGLSDTSGNVGEWVQNCYDPAEDETKMLPACGVWRPPGTTLWSSCVRWTVTGEPERPQHRIGFRLAQKKTNPLHFFSSAARRAVAIFFRNSCLAYQRTQGHKYRLGKPTRKPQGGLIKQAGF